jgi:hypothetical protein
MVWVSMKTLHIEGIHSLDHGQTSSKKWIKTAVAVKYPVESKCSSASRMILDLLENSIALASELLRLFVPSGSTSNAPNTFSAELCN